MATFTVCDICGADLLKREDRYFVKVESQTCYRISPRKPSDDDPYIYQEICRSCAAEMRDLINERMENADSDR